MGKRFPDLGARRNGVAAVSLTVAIAGCGVVAHRSM
jgi:hypothetical protein